MNVVNETDACRQCHGHKEKRVLKAEKCAPDPCAQQKDYASSPQNYGRMAGPLIRLVNDVAAVGDTEINQF